ncbi:uncharacterized protein HMPREF1541_06481 [Cyphellophora europaea CBS 101466]|uniref:F-box domain-containing protein n=1 Tax=Cyphellophora europaea (strain CBS 101466) TaxID=1220924 RepID=W2RPL4_CYPE1|nr:uncharacterized protein HMPREF1541_06481 [Cyphellophora europaea CBS 101466]ETN38446.1 hypothetical protein HMPREF1541_06481 [Cyphellophora europaea CBS 101466]
MSEIVSANDRYHLPNPFVACSCSRCEESLKSQTEENRRAPFHFKAKREDVRVDFSFVINDWILYQAPKEDALGNMLVPKYKSRLHEPSILELPDELLLKIAESLNDSAYKYCLALSCKRLLAIVSDLDANTKPALALQANNKTGPWKQQLLLALARGWIPKDKVKLCFGCWRFMPYGRFSKSVYLKMEKNRTCHLQVRNWLDNWDVKLWFRELRANKDWSSFISDGRLRCPMCVLEGQSLHVRNKGERKKVKGGPPIAALAHKQEIKKEPF